MPHPWTWEAYIFRAQAIESEIPQSSSLSDSPYFHLHLFQRNRMKLPNACNVFSFLYLLISFSMLPATSGISLTSPIMLAVDPAIDGQSHFFIDLESRLKLRDNSFESTFFSGAFRGTKSFGGAYDLNRTSFTGGPSMPHFTTCKFEFEDVEDPWDTEDDEYDDASVQNGRPRGFLERGREISVQGATGVRCTVWISKIRNHQ